MNSHLNPIDAYSVLLLVSACLSFEKQHLFRTGPVSQWTKTLTPPAQLGQGREGENSVQRATAQYQVASGLIPCSKSQEKICPALKTYVTYMIYELDKTA